MGDSYLILLAGALLAIGLLASMLAVRMRVPGLVLFLALGMVVGSDVSGLVHFDDYELARDIGIVALALILFEGGLAAGFDEIRPVLVPSVSLAIVGTLATAALAAAGAHLLFDFSALESLLLGSIVSATDGAATFALLRGSTLRRRVARTLEGESGVNDPIAVLLVIGFIEWIEDPAYGALDMLALFGQEIVIGFAVGAAVGWASTQAFRRMRLATAGLYPVASLATAALAYGGADAIHGSGFLAVYLAGLALGTAVIPAKQTITAFHQGLAWVGQLSMFVVLGLLVFPSQLGDVAIEGAILGLIVVFVARPVAAFVATIGMGFTGSERFILGWAGLRGAIPVVLATFAVIEGVPNSLEFFNIVFFAVLLSTVIQGSTFEPLAQRLGVTTTDPALPRPLAEVGTIRRLGAELLEYPIGRDDAIAGARVRDLGLPRDAVVNVIVRGDQAIPPRGSTRLQEDDVLYVLVREEAAAAVPGLLEQWRSGPLGTPRPPKRVHGRLPVFWSRPWKRADGDPGRPGAVGGERVVEQLRIRRDSPGALVVLEDGRYAITGSLVAVGAREGLIRWARRRMRSGDEAERAWMQTVIGALAADLREEHSP